MKSRILQLTSVHRWNDVRVYQKIAKSLALEGYDVHILAQAPESQIESLPANITVQFIPKARSRTRRIIGSAFLWRKVLKIKPEAVHFHDPELIITAIVLRLLGYKVVYDVHEDYPEDITNKEWIPHWIRSCVRFCFAILESFASRICSANITATEHIGRRFPEQNTVVIRNYPLLEDGKPYSGQPRNSFVYAGTLDALRGVREMIQAFQSLECPSVNLELLGEFPNDELKSWVTDQSRSCKNLIIHGWLEQDEVKRILESSLAGLVILHPTQAYQYALPIKLFEYMAAGIPVVASDFPLWRKIVKTEQCGILVDPLDTRAITHALQWILENPEEASLMGLRGQKAITEKYNWSTEKKTLIDLYEGLMNPKEYA